MMSAAITAIAVGAGVLLQLGGWPVQELLIALVTRAARCSRTLLVAIVAITFLLCASVACLTHEPVPVMHDEFSYLLMSRTFASGNLAMPTPALPEFFETFHVLVRPTYASKYFAGQGLFLAAGQATTGHPIAGVWLSASLACAATAWMLRAWVGAVGALLGAGLMVLQFGVLSYWTQTYWGGMVGALGGALFLGGARRLSRSVSWRDSIWLATGIVLIGITRPVEGVFVILPFGLLLLAEVKDKGSTLKQAAPLLVTVPVVLSVLIAAIAVYNTRVTGSPWLSPYQLHERQYQEAPQFTILPMRPPKTYSSEMLRRFYEGAEVTLYESQQTLPGILSGCVTKLKAWWQFYCGVALTIPLVLPSVLREHWTRHTQIVILILLTAFAQHGIRHDPIGGTMVLAVTSVQTALLWARSDRWGRTAIGSSAGLIVFGLTLEKWFQPHYFAPAAPLVVYLQARGLLTLWYPAQSSCPDINAGDRIAPWSRTVAVCVPIMSAVILGTAVVDRVRGVQSYGSVGAQAFVPERDEWGQRRAAIAKMLAQRPSPNIVFVRYSEDHNPLFEWVFNDVDVRRARVMWARDLGPTHNQLLTQLFANREVWLLEADSMPPRLTPYVGTDR